MVKKTFDCVKMKWQLQEKLYEELNPSSFDDYFKKLKEYSKKSDFWNKIGKNN